MSTATSASVDSAPNPKIGMVLSGGGARGAYEAGALSVLMPYLAKRGERPGIVLGTSIGALNAGHMAATAHLPVKQGIDEHIQIWNEVNLSDVIGPLASPTTLLRLVQYVGGLMGIPQARVPALLDTKPLPGLLNKLIDFDQLHKNVDNELIALAVVATSYATGESMVFHEGPIGKAVEQDVKRGIRYVPTRIDQSHVQSSASIPMAFSSTHVKTPPEYEGYYGDGGTRLNTPIKPALKLGAKAVIVIGLNSSVPPKVAEADAPDIFDGGGQFLQALFADPLAQDVGTLASANREVKIRRAGAGDPVDADGDGVPDDVHDRVPYIFVAPKDRLTVGRLAAEVYKEHLTGIRAFLRARDLVTIGNFLGVGNGPTRGEAFSMLFFATEFHNALIELGKADAAAWLRAPHDYDEEDPTSPWQVGDLPLPEPVQSLPPIRKKRR